MLGEVVLVDTALSMSSSFGQDAAGDSGGPGKPSHIFDPRTGRPVSGAYEAVVIADSAATADALSTALLVLGEHQGIGLIDKLTDVEAVVVGPEGKLRTSRSFEAVAAFAAE